MWKYPLISQILVKTEAIKYELSIKIGSQNEFLTGSMIIIIIILSWHT